MGQGCDSQFRGLSISTKGHSWLRTRIGGARLSRLSHKNYTRDPPLIAQHGRSNNTDISYDVI